MWKWRILPFNFFAFLLLTKRANLTRVFLQMRHVDNCGSCENNICEISEFARIHQGLAKHLNETTKEVYRQLAIFTKMANWRKWGTGQESIKGLVKPQMRWQRGKSWQMAIIRKWQILVEQGKFRQKWRVCQKFMKGILPNIQIRCQKNQQYWQLAISRNWQIEKMGNWARIHQRFGKNSNKVIKRRILINGDYNEIMANFGVKGKSRQKWSIQGFGQIQMRQQKGASWQMTIL